MIAGETDAAQDAEQWEVEHAWIRLIAHLAAMAAQARPVTTEYATARPVAMHLLTFAETECVMPRSCVPVFDVDQRSTERPYGPRPTANCHDGNCWLAAFTVQDEFRSSPSADVSVPQLLVDVTTTARYGAAPYLAAQSHAPVGKTGPGAIVFLATGAAAGVGIVRKRILR